MTDHILVPLDGSPLSRRALRHALDEFPNASITVLHVVDVFDPGYGAYPDFETSYEPLMGSEEWYERAEEVSEQLFDEARELADEYDHEVSTTSEIGDPKRIIVDYADEEEIDHIVLGARTDGGGTTRLREHRGDRITAGKGSCDAHPMKESSTSSTGIWTRFSLVWDILPSTPAVSIIHTVIPSS